jgi:hypothetical protein
MVAGTLFAFFGGTYYWLPEVDRAHVRREARRLALLAARSSSSTSRSSRCTSSGLAGMPRRIPDYAQQFADWNMIASIGAFGFGLSQLNLPVRGAEVRRGDGAKAPASRGKAPTRWRWDAGRRRRRTTRSNAAERQVKRSRRTCDGSAAADARAARRARSNRRTAALAVRDRRLCFFFGFIASHNLRGPATGMTVVGTAVLLFHVVAIGRNCRVPPCDERRGIRARATARCSRKLGVVVVGMFGVRLRAGAVLREDLRGHRLRNIAQADAVANTQVDATRSVRVEFDANVRNLPWQFQAARADRRRASRRVTQASSRS